MNTHPSHNMNVRIFNSADTGIDYNLVLSLNRNVWVKIKAVLRQHYRGLYASRLTHCLTQKKTGVQKQQRIHMGKYKN